jgi:transposase-like protein/DNA-directed RNA polymerase subunit RPC12/RpoP
MSSTITSALSSSIGFIQLKLSDFGQEEIDFEKILDERFQNVETPRNVNQKLELLKDTHMDYLNPVCPYCDSKKIIKQEYRDRNLILENQKPVKVYLRRYKCKSCKKKFITSLDSIIESGYRYPTTFKDKLSELFQTGYRSLRNASEDLLNFFGIKISYQTIHNWQQIITKNQIQNIETSYSGYYCYDEQYVKINGVWMYRLTLFDHILNIPVSEEIAPDKKYNTIKQFILESTNNKPLIAITTDHVPEYKNIMDELNVKHQLCIFHFYKMIGDELYKLLRSKKTSDDEKNKIEQIFQRNKKNIRYKQLQNRNKRFRRIIKMF